MNEETHNVTIKQESEETMKFTHLVLLSLFVSPVALNHDAEAGIVKVVNENKKNLKIRIKAEGDQLRENLASYVEIIPAEYNYTFTVKPENLKGKTHFSIKGDTNPFTMGDKCEHLSADANYSVTFINDITGTTCVAEKIP